MTTIGYDCKLEFFVPGTPAPQGSKRYIGRGISLESSKALPTWRHDIRTAAQDYATQVPWSMPFTGQPLTMGLVFVMPRPTSTPKRRTPPAIKRPDLDKLLRAVCDALTTVLFTDDSAITRLTAAKRLADIGETPGAHIVLTAFEAES